jgi:hypothetical protein
MHGQTQVKFGSLLFLLGSAKQRRFVWEEWGQWNSAVLDVFWKAVTCKSKTDLEKKFNMGSRRNVINIIAK